MQVQFSKMHGLGNDFMVIDNVTQNVFFSKEKIQQLANRNFGIGFDQLLMVEPPYDPEQDFHYRIFNADGSEVEQCGNGARCFARFVKQKGLINRNKIVVSTKAGKMVLYLEKDGQVTVNMGKPEFEPANIPLTANKQENTYILRVGERTLFIGSASMGNPHCVMEVDDVDTADVAEIGPLVEKCAAVAIGQIQGKLGKDVRVDLPGGSLRIRWPGPDNVLKMTGPAEHVYDGHINL